MFVLLYKLMVIYNYLIQLFIERHLMHYFKYFGRNLTSILVILLIASCASQPKSANSGGDIVVGQNPTDPWEKSNRKVDAFNNGLDRYLLLPAAKGYDFITPQIMQDGATNFFNNVGEPYVMVNDALQLKMVSFYKGLARFSINSVIGLFGIIDVAAYMGLERHSEDFGQTLGAWGTPAGPYAVLPFLGPSTARDSVISITEFFYAPRLSLLDFNDTQRWTLSFISILNNRNRLRQTEEIIIGDRYTFIRDAYLQNRRYQVLDGQVLWDEYELEEVPEGLDELDLLDDLDLDELDLDELDL